jgi:Tol biopolymer transport system component
LEARGLWPCWSPGGELIAVSRLETSGREPLATIDLLDFDGVALRTAHNHIPGAPPVIAPRVPHYVQWSPDGRTLSFVAPGSDALGLHLSDAGGAYSSDRIATGAPLFHSWSPDGRHIGIHAGANLSLFTLATRATTPIASDAIGFRVPVFAQGHLFFARPAPPGVSLMALRLDGDKPGGEWEAGRFGGGVVLQAVPGGVSVAMTREPDTGSFHELWVVRIDANDALPALVARGPFVAALWSPEGDRVALVIPTQMGDGRYSVQVRGRDGSFLAASEGFVPSQDFRTYLGFFDQYALSHHLWAPDGSALLMTGRLAGDAVSWSFADRQLDYVWYWPARRGTALDLVCSGDAAFFPPPGSHPWGEGNAG